MDLRRRALVEESRRGVATGSGLVGLPLGPDAMRPSTRPGRPTHRAREAHWRATHREEIRRHSGEWVVLEGEEIVGAGPDPVQLAGFARGRGIEVPYLFFVEDAGPNTATKAVDADVCLDTGAERSLFGGYLCPLLGIDVFTGRPWSYQSTSGQGLEARLHNVRLEHPDLGSFEIEVGFSVGRISRNLLGRDFLALVQVGLGEARQVLYIAARP